MPDPIIVDTATRIFADLCEPAVINAAEEGRWPEAGEADRRDADMPEHEIDILRAWIDQGADWPESATIASTEQRVHWAYVKPVRHEPPAVTTRC